MAGVRRKAVVSKTSEPIKYRPPLSAEAKETEMISLATDLAEKQLREGTASSQVICHYLKLGTMKEKRELEKLEHEIKLIDAKTEGMESVKKIEELYSEAMAAMKSYRMDSDDEDEEEL